MSARGYIDQSVDERDDKSSKLLVTVKVDQPYVNRVRDALRLEAEGEEDTFRRSAYHRTLESFINSVIDAEYEFDEPLLNREIVLNSENLFLFSVDEDKSGNFFDGKITFFTQAADNNYFFDRKSFHLHFKGGLELADLSDGEYQLLFLYSLLDLFDSDDTLFLLDEVDSHLHYKNVDNLWKALASIKGMAITTTHLIDSITAPENSFESLKLIIDGKVDDGDKTKAIIGRLSNLSRIESVQFNICAKLENIVLMDDYNDWTIFLALAEQKGLDVSKLSCVSVVKKASGKNSDDEELGKAKLEWVGLFLSNSKLALKTKNVLLVCDRDEGSITFKRDGVSVGGKKATAQLNELSRSAAGRIKLHFLAWHRREIKNYLVSFSALRKHGLLDELHDEVAPKYQLKVNDAADGNKQIACLDVKDVIAKIIDTVGVGIDKDKLCCYVKDIPPSEISQDIENMYNYIAGKACEL